MSEPKDSVVPNCFPTTQWTLILDVIQNGDDKAARMALDLFCQRYWHAIYNFFLRRKCSHDRAQDYTQSFFHSRILGCWEERDSLLHDVQRNDKRKFRVFLAVCLWSFLKDQWRAAHTQKAGGKIEHVSFEDIGDASGSADQAAFKKFGREFDQLFAVEAIKNAAKRSTHSEVFMAYFVRKERDGDEAAQKEIAAELDMTVASFKKGYHEFRARLRKELWKEVAQYAGPGEDEIEDEIKYLLSLFPDSLT
ncbi:MAG TPA: hypothetical protein VH413_00625 [Verrucomicrobiae bacterium]|jgi:DNA-directed RNA polymerase specialized sigma24 family protein|nr:hypothetical protein [Verrucomicrobiae bacterium]